MIPLRTIHYLAYQVHFCPTNLFTLPLEKRKVKEEIKMESTGSQIRKPVTYGICAAAKLLIQMPKREGTYTCPQERKC
jgi:hypothetical protein